MLKSKFVKIVITLLVYSIAAGISTRIWYS